MMRRMMRSTVAFVLAATVAACGGGSSSSDTGPTPPAAPSGVAALASSQQVSVSWTAVTGATSYNVYWGTAAGVTKATGTKVTGASNPFVHTGLTNGTTYYYVVTAVASGGESAISSEVSARPVPPIPAAPTSLSAAPGDQAVTLTWTASTGATTYNVYWKTTPGVTKANGTKIAGQASGYVHSSLTNGTPYYYVVTAENLGGESAVSAEASAVPSATPAPAAPTGLAAVGGDQQVTLTWATVTGATSYDLYWSTTTGVTKGTGTKIAGVTSGYVHSSLTNGTTYYYVVTASNANGESTDSAQASAMPVPPAPAAPTGVGAAAGDTTVTVTWAAVSGATSYNLYWKTSAGVSKSDSKITGVTSGYVHTGRTNGTTYYYVVTAVNLGGESVVSSEVSATPVPPAPAAPGGVSASPGTAQNTISWSPVTGATSYNIYWKTSAGVSTSDNKITGATSPYVHSPLTNGTTYYYVVTAVNLGGESVVSAEVSAKPMPGLLTTPPSGVTATAGDSKVTVGWSAVTGATAYNLYWRTTPGVNKSNGTKIAGVSSPYDHTALSNLTPYYYVVTAENISGETAESAEVSAVPVQTTYSISGTISGVTTGGRIYLGVMYDGCTGCSPNWGTSVPSGTTAWTIHGVTPGTYRVYAGIDVLGKGAANLTFPSGMSSTVNVSSADVTGVSIAILNASLPSPAVPTIQGAIAGNSGAFLVWQTVSMNGVEMVTGYDVQWATDSGFTTGVGNASVVANDQGYLLAGLANGTDYWFRVRSKINATTSAYSAPFGPFLVGPGSGGNTVSGTVTFPGTATGPLYVALGLPDSMPVYVARIANPVSPQAYSFAGVDPISYSVYAILDQNNDGVIDAGDLANPNVPGLAPLITVTSGNVTQNVTLTASNAAAVVMTNHGKQGANEDYSAQFRVADQAKLVVAARLTSGRGVATPVDLPRIYGSHEFNAYLGTARPTVGDVYRFSLTYADGTTATVDGTVSGILDSFVGSPTATPTPSATVPTFSWTAPASPPAWYGYRFQISDNMGFYWDYPRDGLMSGSTTSVQFNADGNASSPSLTSGRTYHWSTSVFDAKRNSTSMRSDYTP